MKALVALAIVAGLAWVGYQKWSKEDPKVPAPVNVNVNVPQPFGGTAPAGDKIYVP